MLVMPPAPSRADVEALCDDVRELAGCDGNPFCDVGDVAQPDADTIDAMARLQLVALRVGVRFRFTDACEELRDLLALTGLADVLPCEQPPCDPPAARPQAAPVQASSRSGRPNNGNMLWVSRKNVIPEIRPPEISST
jgi:hypothetical protein